MFGLYNNHHLQTVNPQVVIKGNGSEKPDTYSSAIIDL